jgi:arsenite oxidase small subunit
MITASAVQNLPQIVLEVDGDDIYAVGVLGLIYGYQDNLQGV